MRKLTLLLSLPLLSSCSGNSSENTELGNILENLTFTLDTVMIDSKEELLFLQWGLAGSTVSQDQSEFFNFIPKDYELEQFDLDSRTLLKKISMEREGPLGTGDAQLIQMDNQGNIYFIGLWELRIFNPSLDSMTLIKLTPEVLSGLEPEDAVGSEAMVTADGKFFISTYFSKGQTQAGMLVVSLQDLAAKKYPFDLGKKLDPFAFKLVEDGALRMSTVERIFLTEVDQKIIVSSVHFNEGYILDLAKDTLMLKSHHSQLTADEKKRPEKSIAESFPELENLMEESGSQVRFGGYVFDPIQNRIWRFSQEPDSPKGGKKSYKNVVTLFDLDLNQLGETFLEISPEMPMFFKDGKLWSYVNVQDELGFAVIDFKF
ncbi:DUF4221 family protein [Algoriphagus confluentis]|uniref:DUF4221 domain-containing protein n=1 Tax=Algoriphagus confluentis TaxID=1697556 RepID=A0ABQ6PSC5_9BACT|nr:hypothetical protein Aconfl_27260 [Algoriphagus confluentis]